MLRPGADPSGQHMFDEPTLTASFAAEIEDSMKKFW